MSDFSATLWTAARQAPLSMGFPRQEYWNGLPFPSPGDLPHQGLQADSLLSKPAGKPILELFQYGPGCQIELKSFPEHISLCHTSMLSPIPSSEMPLPP